MWAELQTSKNPKNSVLRDRDLTGKYEKGVNYDKKYLIYGIRWC